MTTSRRVWSKGSARGVGSQQQSGTVQTKDAVDLGLLHSCKCGSRQSQCSQCSAWTCRAPGHLEHRCGGIW